jgi:sporulation protein YlmC with PRC-barrel domain
MVNNQFENSRVSEGTLRAGHPAPQDAVTDAEISIMIAVGGPASPAGGAPGVASASTLMGRRVLTAAGDELGNIEEIMLDLRNGRIAYAVLTFTGFPGVANKRFPVPWNALRTDSADFILDVDRKTFEGAPDFDKDNWPDMADTAFGRREPSSDRGAEVRH